MDAVEDVFLFEHVSMCIDDKCIISIILRTNSFSKDSIKNDLIFFCFTRLQLNPNLRIF